MIDMDSEPSGSRHGPSLQTEVTRYELFIVLRNERFYGFSASKCNERLMQYILNKVQAKDLPVCIQNNFKEVIKVFVSKIMTKWRECKYTFERFNKKHGEWLAENVKLPEIPCSQPRSSTESTSTSTLKKARGRPSKKFQVSSKRSKQRKLKSLVTEHSPERICLAASASLTKSGKRSAAQVIAMAMSSSPKSLKKMKKAHSSISQNIIKYSSDEALELAVDLNLTRDDYLKMRMGAKSRNADIYPSYHNVASAKKLCYPSNKTVTENEAIIPLQDLVNHTVQRLVQVQSEVIAANLKDSEHTLQIYYKWGLDGSGGHRIYKQNFSNNSIYADSNIILCTLVILEISLKRQNEKVIFWKNQTPSSIRYCRPIFFKIKKETSQNTKEEYEYVNKQIQELVPTKTMIGYKIINFKHEFICTMLDGKTINVLTETKSSQACNVCKATPIHTNDIENLLIRECDESTFKFGVSVLHAHIRCYEYLLHIAYKMELKQWQARGKEAQDKVKDRKRHICKLFYQRLGLVVDQPTQAGGNSNDGDTARNFFKNVTVVSEITDISKDLLKRFANILLLISCGHYIDENKFKEYCLDTAKMAIDMYGWYRMSASVHKILIHGADIIKSLPLPLGQLSEDVLEASHKSYKKLRQYHSRKTSRIDTNTDILNWMLIISDPVISSHRKKTKKNSENFNEIVIGMLRMPHLLYEEIDEDDDAGTEHDVDDA